MKIKNIIIVFFCLLSLSSCQIKMDEKIQQEQKKETQTDKLQEGEVGRVKETQQKDPKEMSLEEIEDELENMEDIDLEKDLEEIDQEL